MKFNYKLRRLCGSYYGHSISTTGGSGDVATQWSGSNIIYDSTGNLLISAVSNRIQVIDLKLQTVRTLGTAEGRSNISRLALSPDDALLIAVDVKNYAMIINFHRGVVMHRINFQQKVRDLQFSPCGRLLAVTHGKVVQIWYTPAAHRKEFSPLTLHQVYAGLADDVTCLQWSADSTVLAAGSRDCTVRIWTVDTVKNYQPATLSGHKEAVVGLYFGEQQSSSEADKLITTLHTISRNGAMVTWECIPPEGEVQVQDKDEDDDDDDDDDDDENDEKEKAFGDEAVDFFTGGGSSNKRIKVSHSDEEDLAHKLVKGQWKVKKRHYFNQERAEVTSTALRSNILAVGFSTGLFGLYEFSEMNNIHTLSVGNNQLVRSCVLNNTGEWLALACPRSQQLLVWEWPSETYVLKQRGHAYGMSCMSYSPDGVVIATGGEDGKVKLWNAITGFCYVTLEKSHTAPITAIVFANASVVLSASLDGTVRAHDLHRYRTFKTFTTPTPVQFLSLAVDPAGEIVCAGSSDPFHIYVWNLQTAKVLDILTGHTGPVCALQFQSNGSGTLVSASWDGTAKTWDLYKGNIPTESLQHSTDVVCISCRPDGKQICTGTVNGLLSFWNVESAKLLFQIDGRRDITGGRKINDRMASNNNAGGRYFTSISYSADGCFLLAGGNSKYVCIYEISQQILLKKIQITFNRSLDGVLDELNSKNLIDGVPIDDHADSGDESPYHVLALPGAKRGDDGSRTSRVEVLTRQLSFSSTGREWSVVSGEGLHVYSVDDDMVFDPIQLTESITPKAVEKRLKAGNYGIALRMAIHLNEVRLIKHVLDNTPYDAIVSSVRTVSVHQLERLLQIIAQVIAVSPHIEFYLHWCLGLLQTHGMYMEKHRATFLRAFRAMYKSVSTKFDELKTVSDENKYLLDFLEDQSQLQLQFEDQSETQTS